MRTLYINACWFAGAVSLIDCENEFRNKHNFHLWTLYPIKERARFARRQLNTKMMHLNASNLFLARMDLHNKLFHLHPFRVDFIMRGYEQISTYYQMLPFLIQCGYSITL